MSGLRSTAFRRPTSTPMVQRTHDCTAESIDYTDAGEKPQVAKCRDCGRTWTMGYAPNGDPTGYDMRAPLAGLLASVTQ